jgi:glycosyltransferase involved in cell wall biosynthesis
MTRSEPHYGLVTAFRNEMNWLTDLVRSIESQSIKPAAWVLVDDGSTDDSLDHARNLTRHIPFVESVALVDTGTRNFASQVYAQLAGVERLAARMPAYLGFLDADILVPPDYYETMLERFRSDPRLGIAGGHLLDQIGGSLVDTRAGSHDYHVPGGIQLFRSECYQQAGGYIPIEGGGQDVVVETTAMMNGWTVRAFPSPDAIHLRPFGSSSARALSRHVAWGRKFYTIGYHPLYFAASTVRRVSEPPYLLSAGAKMVGYIGAFVRRKPRAVSPEVMKYLRRQQVRRLLEVRNRRRSRMDLASSSP